MKNAIILMLVAFSFQSTTAQTSFSESPQENVVSSSITVKVTGLNSNKGKVYIGIYDSKEDWLEKKVYGEVVKINDRVSYVEFDNIPLGTYAVSITHDENDNDKMDTGMFGIPTEDYGCSRGAKGRFGPPKWNDAKFELTTAQKDIHIKL